MDSVGTSADSGQRVDLNGGGEDVQALLQEVTLGVVVRQNSGTCTNLGRRALRTCAISQQVCGVRRAGGPGARETSERGTAPVWEIQQVQLVPEGDGRQPGAL